MSKEYSVEIRHLPRLHAKVYVGDADIAIITSGNLTAGGMTLNFEYGVEVTRKPMVAAVRDDITLYSNLGASINGEQLERYCEIAEELQRTFVEQNRSAKRFLKIKFETLLIGANDELLRLRVARGSVTKIFEDTVEYLLKVHGPMDTKSLHIMIAKIHPDLCDDSVDRVINGQHFGKQWKHAVRTAQSHLKNKGVVELNAGRWELKVGN